VLRGGGNLAGRRSSGIPGSSALCLSASRMGSNSFGRQCQRFRAAGRAHVRFTIAVNGGDVNTHGCYDFAEIAPKIGGKIRYKSRTGNQRVLALPCRSASV